MISSSSVPINGVNEQANDKDEIVKKALEEEAALMNQLKVSNKLIITYFTILVFSLLSLAITLVCITHTHTTLLLLLFVANLEMSFVIYFVHSLVCLPVLI